MSFEEEKQLLTDLRMVMEHLYHVSCSQYNTICSLNKTIEERDSSINTLQDDLNDLAQKYEQAQIDHKDELEQQSAKFNAELTKKEDLLQQSLAAFQTAKNRYETLYKRVEAEKTKLDQETTTLANNIAQFSQEKERYANLQVECDNWKSKFNELNEISTKKENKLNGELAAAQNKIAELSEEISKLKANPALHDSHCEAHCQTEKPEAQSTTTTNINYKNDLNE